MLSAEYFYELEIPLIALRRNDKRPVKTGWPETKIGEHLPEHIHDHYGVICGKKTNEGKYVYVLDIDPKNGGDDSFKEVFGEDFDTATVRSGSGGTHFYFYHTEELPRVIDLVKGIDFIGLGGYIVGPGTQVINEIDGELKVSRYTVINDTEIADLPKVILEKLEEKKNKKREEPLYTQTISKVESGGRNNVLASYGGKLRDIGMELDQIYPMLRGVNQEFSEPLPLEEVFQVAKSVSSYQPTHSLNPEPDIDKVQMPEDPLARMTEYDDFWTTLHGAVCEDMKLLMDFFMSRSVRVHPNFGFAAAVSVMSAVYQGVYELESFEPQFKNIPLNTYQTILSVAGGGKDDYLSGIKEFLLEVDPRLVGDDPNSSHGLRRSLWCFESRLFVKDEAQEFLETISGQKASTHMKQLLSDMKELYNCPKALTSRIAAASVVPIIHRPYFSMLYASQPETFIGAINRELLAGGLLSRFMIYQALQDKPELRPKKVPDMSTVKAVMRYELAQVLADPDNPLKFTDKMKTFTEACKGGGEIHKPALNKAKKIVGWKPEALKLMKDNARAFDSQYRFRAKSEFGDKSSTAALISRVSLNAAKIAALHCIGKSGGEPMIDETDVQIGVNVAKKCLDLSNNLSELLQDRVTHGDMAQKIDRMLASGETINCREDLLMKYRRNFNRKQLDAILVSLYHVYGARLLVRYKGSTSDFEPFDLTRKTFQVRDFKLDTSK